MIAGSNGKSTFSFVKTDRLPSKLDVPFLHSYEGKIGLPRANPRGNPGIEPRSPALQVYSSLSKPPGMDQTVKESPLVVSHETQITRHWSIHIKANKGRCVGT